MAKQAQSKIARTIPPVVGASTLASLETRTTPAAATAPASAGLRTGRQITGQYLYDQFIADNKADATKMDIVRRAVDNTDVNTFKTAVNDMVGVAAKIRDDAIEAAKQAGTYNEAHPSGEVAFSIGRHKTAMNHQTVLRIAYGALKFARQQLDESGYTDTTGYQMMAVIARKALKDANVKWDGSPVLAKDQTAQRNESKAEAKALQTVMLDNPRNQGESLADYLLRVGDVVDAKVIEQRAEAERKQVDDLVKKVRAMAGGLLDDVITRLLDQGEPETLDPEAAKAAAPAATKH